MKIIEIKEMINIAKSVDINKLESSNPSISKCMKFIYQFIQRLDVDYTELIEKLNSSNVRFCDYYDHSLHGEEITNYFKDSYHNEDFENAYDIYNLYVTLKNAQDLIYNLDLCDTLDELVEILGQNYFKDMIYLITTLKERKKAKEEQEDQKLSFLNENNKYKILFTGFSYKDITDLEKNITKAFINKVSGQLCNSDVIVLAESVDHVKDLYDFPLFRIQFANDYRISYIRKNGITAIVGITIKSGKDTDYTRYDYIAKNSDEIYEEINLLQEGKLPKESQHFKVVEYLEKFNEKNRIMPK